jgi:NitT/TauT family transport system substrate-binding protein
MTSLLGAVVLLSTCGGAAVSSSPSAAAGPASAAAKPSSGAPSASAAASGSASTGKFIVSTGNVTMSLLPYWLAQDAGIFQKSGLNVELQVVSGGINAAAALLSGQIQVSDQGGPQTVSGAAGGANIVVLGTFQPIYNFKFYVQPNIKTLQDLKGKKVDLRNVGSTVDIATKVGLRRAGANPDTDFTYVATGSLANGVTALLNGAVDGGLVSVPESLKLDAKGLHPLFDMGEWKIPFATNAIVVQRSYFTLGHDALQKYIDGLVQGAALAHKDKATSLKVMKTGFKSDDDQAMNAAYDYYVNEIMPSLPYATPDQFKDAIDLLSQTDEKIKGFDVSKIIDRSLVQSAADRGLDK